MAADDAAVVVTLRANLKDYEAALKSAVRATERAAKAAEGAIANVGKGSGGSNVIAGNFQKGASQIANDAKVLQFQLNDIFSGIASGQGVRAVQQQLGQIAQQMSGGSLAQGARTMGAALVGMVNPINAAVVAFGFLASAAASYFSDTDEDADKVNKKLQEQAAALKAVASEYGALVPLAKQAIETLLEQGNAEQAVSTLENQITDLKNKAINGLLEGVKELDGAYAQMKENLGLAAASESIATLDGKIENLRKAIESGNGAADAMAQVMAEIDKIAIENPTAGLELFAQVMRSDVLPSLRDQIAIQQRILELQTAITEQAAAAAEKARWNLPAINQLTPLTSGAGVFNPSQTQLEQAEEAKKAAKRAAEEAERGADQAAKEAARKAVQEAEEAAEKLTNSIVRQSAVAVDLAATMLGKSENANRGEINAFLKAGGVDLDAASTAWCAAFVNASLARVGIKGTGSNVATDFLNFGTGVDLANLQKGDVLVQPRGHQAGEEGGHVGLATGQIRLLGDTIQQVEILSGNSADKVTTQWVDASTVIARRATDAFQVPSDALDALTAKSKTTATDVEKQWQQLNQQFAGAVGGALSGFINDLIAGEDAGDAFAKAIQRLTSQLIDMMVQLLIIKPLMTALGGGLGGGLVPIGHGGGSVSLIGAGHHRQASPLMFAGAPRYASGGMVGLKPGEVPIIAHRGEIIVPNARRLAGTGATGGGVQNTYSMDNAKISIDMAQTGMVAADSESAKAFGENVQKIIQAEMVRQSRPGGLLRKVPN